MRTKAMTLTRMLLAIAFIPIVIYFFYLALMVAWLAILPALGLALLTLKTWPEKNSAANAGTVTGS